MIKYLKIRTTFIFCLIFISCFTFFISQCEARDPSYNAFVDVDLKWSDKLTDEPIVPRDEIVELELTIIMEIFTGEGFGAGLLVGYKSSSALIDLYILEYPKWSSVTLERNLLVTNISEREEASISLFLHIDENAPAFTDGLIKLGVNIDDLGFIKGVYEVFNLTFKPAFFPIIKTDLPEMNTKKINPSSEATFPIEIENAGNGETKVFFKVLNVPDDWLVSISDSIILGESKGSKGTAYLTIIPSRSIGYHYDEANIVVEILPTFAEDINIKGKPIYANFLVQNRGLSTTGFEFYLPIGIIIFIILIIIVSFFRKNLKKK